MAAGCIPYISQSWDVADPDKVCNKHGVRQCTYAEGHGEGLRHEPSAARTSAVGDLWVSDEILHRSVYETFISQKLNHTVARYYVNKGLTSDPYQLWYFQFIPYSFWAWVFLSAKWGQIYLFNIPFLTAQIHIFVKFFGNVMKKSIQYYDEG